MKKNERAPSVYRLAHLWPLAVIIIGIGACAAGAAVSQPYWDFFGLLLILSLASLLGGSLFGFQTMDGPRSTCPIQTSKRCRTG